MLTMTTTSGLNPRSWRSVFYDIDRGEARARYCWIRCFYARLEPGGA